MSVRILVGDCLDVLGTLPDESVHCCVTSPPYWGLRDYGEDGQLGLESTPEEYVEKMVAVFREVWRVLRDDGTVWLNLGDSYAANRSYQVVDNKHSDVGNHGAMSVPDGLKPKDLVGIPWRVAFALQSDGWWLRQDIIWQKPNPMPESVRDRCTKAHEYVFLLSKSARYFYDAEAIAEESIHAGRVVEYDGTQKNASVDPDLLRTRIGGANGSQSVTVGDTRNRRSVWSITTKPFSDWRETVRRVRVPWDDVSGDTTRTPSEGCPVHVSMDRLHPTLECDARAAWNRYHNPGSDGCPVEELLRDYAPTVLSRALGSTDGSSGSHRPPRSPSATARNTETRRTAPDPATIPPCTPSAETTPRTERTSGGHGSAEHRPGMSASRTSEDEIDGSRSNQSPNHTAGNGEQLESSAASLGGVLMVAGCTCHYYTERTEKVSHFATFPPELPELCIKAGCPENVCAICGSVNGCRCAGTSTAGTVLDPFGGAGTIGLVADRLKRDAILIELNPEYAAMAERRIYGDAPLFADVEVA